MKKKIENIKNVRAFKKELLKIAEKHFDLYGFADGDFFFAPLDRDRALAYAEEVIDEIYNPIRKKYCQEKDKLYRRAINECEHYLRNDDQHIKELERKVAELTKRNNELAEADFWRNKFDSNFTIGQQVYYIKYFGYYSIETSKINSIKEVNEVVCLLDNGEEINQKELFATHKHAEEELAIMEAE